MQIIHKTHGDIYTNQLILTKCLNTSVLLTCIALGCENLNKIKYCDVDNTRLRHTSKVDDNSKIHLNLINDLTNKLCSKKSYFYYIMLTDGTLYDKKGSSIYFPGHVFIINKTCVNGFTGYDVYQSYINEYTLNEYLGFRHKKSGDIIEQIKLLYEYFSIGKDWDDEMVKIWKRLSTVDSTNFIGYSTKGIYICYKRFFSNTIETNINKFINKTMKQMNTLIKTNQHDYFDMKQSYSDQKDIYGLQKDINLLKKKN